MPPFPCPLTGHSLSAGYTVSSHTKVPLKYQFVYSSVLNMQCAVKEMSDSQGGKAESVLMAQAAVIFSEILLLSVSSLPPWNIIEGDSNNYPPLYFRLPSSEAFKVNTL